MKAQSAEKNTGILQQADRLQITYFTDPLCCWSWGFEPQWRKLLYEFDGQIDFTYCMAGLIPSWKDYNDSENSVSRPIQMGPVWMHAAQLTGMPMNTKIWMQDPPASSYPACIAVKCATLQSKEAGHQYLRKCREAIMLKGENIAQIKVLENIAKELAAADPSYFNIDMFYDDLKNDNGLEAFRKDTNRVQLTGISRYPTLLIKYADKNPILITGYRPYSALIDAVQQIAPALKKTNIAKEARDYAKYWNSITEKELSEAKAGE